MTAAFSEGAARCCAIAVRLLGWRPAEFWAATPAELAMALSASEDLASLAPPSPETIARMMERDAHE